MNGSAILAALIGFFRKLWEARHEWGPAAAVAYIQKLREEARRHRVNAAIAQADAYETRRNMAEYETYRADPDGNDKWLRERAGLTDKL